MTYGDLIFKFREMPDKILGYYTFSYENETHFCIKNFYQKNGYLVFTPKGGWYGTTPDLIVTKTMNFSPPYSSERRAIFIECELFSSDYPKHNHKDELVDIVFCIEDNLSYFGESLPKKVLTFNDTLVAPGEGRQGLLWVVFNLIYVPKDKWKAEKLIKNEEKLIKILNTTEKGIVAKFLVELCLQDKTRNYFRSRINREKERLELQKRLEQAKDMIGRGILGVIEDIRNTKK